jgi:hypothetical protein
MADQTCDEPSKEIKMSDNRCTSCSGIQSDIKALKERMDFVIVVQGKALEVAKREVDRRLEGMNNFQHRMDRQENLFATRAELASLQKLFWIGIGLVVALQVVFGFIVESV